MWQNKIYDIGILKPKIIIKFYVNLNTNGKNGEKSGKKNWHPTMQM